MKKCVCPVSDREVHHSIVKVAGDPRGDNRTDAWETCVNLFFYNDQLSTCLLLYNADCSCL